MTWEQIRAKMLYGCCAKVEAARADLARQTAHLPVEAQAAMLAEFDIFAAKQTQTLDREWAAFEHLLRTGQISPEDPKAGELVEFAAQPRARRGKGCSDGDPLRWQEPAHRRYV